MPFASDQQFSITQIPDTELWELDREIVYFGIHDIVIPETYIADGSTIPRWAWVIVGHPLQGDNGLAGFLHDYITEIEMFDRKTCDLIFLEALKDLGTPFWKRQLMYRAVRLNSIVKGYK